MKYEVINLEEELTISRNLISDAFEITTDEKRKDVYNLNDAYCRINMRGKK
jgi:hypothetical protein